MIFAIEGHIERIINETKTQTRRSSDRYEVGRKYSIQPGRGQKAITEGKILIVDKKLELIAKHFPIKANDAEAEGGYTVEDFENLYEKIHPFWGSRFAYTFRFIPKKGV